MSDNLIDNPNEFYEILKTEKLEKLKNKNQTINEIAYLERILDKNNKILDLGCGYGRLTIPLAKKGYDIVGLDASSYLIKKAKLYSKNEELNIDFIFGDMRNLPFKKESFDIVLCLWSVFLELIDKNSQVKAINEMFRVLKKDGFSLIEMPKPVQMFFNRKGEIEFKKSKNSKVVYSTVSGVGPYPIYNHNKKTLKSLIKDSDVKKYKVYKDYFGCKKRLFLKFWK
jgi:ubiquinone/menaquinone biosynthesis C-methylase UbiE